MTEPTTVATEPRADELTNVRSTLMQLAQACNARGFDLLENSSPQKHWYALRDEAHAAVDSLDNYRGAHAGQRAAMTPLAGEHHGMRVDYQGLFKQARAALRRDPALAEMLRQFQDHVTELGRRWYAGDTAVVDELLQLYCVERETRAAIAAAPTQQQERSE